MKLLKAMATVAGLTFVSRIAGFLRDVLTAAFLGAGPVADAFFVALKLPNLFRRVTAEGAFSVSFVPLYSRILEEDGEGKAGEFAGRSFSIMLLALSIFTVVFMIAMPWVIAVIAPGFDDDIIRFPLAVELSRITFPYLLLISLTALFGGVLNAHHRFAPFAAAPIIFNLSLVVALVFGTKFMPSAGHAMAWGITISGLLQLLFMSLFIRRHKIKFHIRKPQLTAPIKKLFRLMAPGALGAGVMHINLFADMIIASLLPAGAISYLYYADRLNQLPLGVVGIAIGTALLPMLSRSLAAGRTEESRDLYNRSLEYCFMLALPAAVALFIIPSTLITVLFERGEFTAEDTKTTTMVLMGYSIGLPAYVAVKVFSTAFWAKGDTLTPVKISIAVTLLNIVLAFIFSRFVGVAGIAFATGLVGWLYLILLKYKLRGSDHAVLDVRFKKNILKILFATIIMGCVLYGVANTVKIESYDGLFTKIFELSLLVASGLISYTILIFMTGVVRITDLKTFFSKRS